MNVDFNNLRKQTAYSLDRVIKILNNGIMPQRAFQTMDLPNGKVRQFSGDLLVDSSEIQKHLDNLRSNVWALLCCYEEGNDNYKCVWEEVEETGGLARFNDNDDD